MFNGDQTPTSAWAASMSSSLNEKSVAFSNSSEVRSLVVDVSSIGRLSGCRRSCWPCGKRTHWGYSLSNDDCLGPTTRLLVDRRGPSRLARRFSAARTAPAPTASWQATRTNSSTCSVRSGSPPAIRSPVIADNGRRSSRCRSPVSRPATTSSRSTPTSPPVELAAIMTHSGAKVLIAGERFAAQLEDIDPALELDWPSSRSGTIDGVRSLAAARGTHPGRRPTTARPAECSSTPRVRPVSRRASGAPSRG